MNQISVEVREWDHNRHGVVAVELADETDTKGCVMEPVHAAAHAGAALSMAFYADKHPGSGRKRYGKMAILQAFIDGICQRKNPELEVVERDGFNQLRCEE